MFLQYPKELQFMEKPKTTLITEEESLFINAILNLPIVRKFIENSNSPRGYLVK